VALPAGRDEGRIATIAAALLVGGASSRMGRDKSRLEVAGVANATRLGRLLGGLFEELLIVGGDPPAEAPGRRVADPEGPVCALRGLVAALEAARAPRVLVVATDLPLLTADLVLALVAWPEADAVVPLDARGLHPLCAIYRRETLLPPAREHLEAGRLQLRGPLDAVATSYFGPDELARVDPNGHALTNVNTPEDLVRAEALLSGSQ
jgi:molybdopterin-guanine dinucleotide biosynthesis protein A